MSGWIPSKLFLAITKATWLWTEEWACSDQLGQCCSQTFYDLVNSNSNWKQRCTWGTTSYVILALPPENMAMTPDRHHHTIALESASKRCTPPRLIVGPSILKVKDTLHRMNMSDKRNIIDDANALPFTIWLDELGGIHWEEHWAYSHESFTVSYEMHVWITWQFHEGWWPHILEGYVLTGGKFMTDWQSWWVLARCVQLMREQFSRESRRWMIG
jgi:hypothetical protein